APTSAFSYLRLIGLPATADIMPPQDSSPMLPSPPCRKEANSYYAGLPSRPILVARTGAEWEEPTGLEAYSVIRELRPVGNHAITEVWEDNLAFKIHALLDKMKVKWTSTDVVRIGNEGESSAPVILWIGVMPGSLSGDDGLVVASRCWKLLEKGGITDMEVEIRESVVTRSAGPKLLEPSSGGIFICDPTVNIREPLTTTPCLPICSQSVSWTDGTGGFFITEGDNTRTLLVTARHVVFPPGKSRNEPFEHKDGHPHYNVNLFGDTAFEGYLESIQTEIEREEFYIDYHKRCIEAARENDTPEWNKGREAAQEKLNKAKKAVEVLKTFYHNVSAEWDTPESRVLGHVILSPPIELGVGSDGYTEDWAIIEIDPAKIDRSNFSGNVIDLGTRISIPEFVYMISPNRENPSFEYPLDRLLKLEGTIPDEEMRHPTAVDRNNEPCLMVMKRGNTTGLTVGRANNTFSYVRYYYDDNVKTSKEWAILPRDSKSGAFSELGDSGSVIVDGRGRMGGLLTAGAGIIDSSDITYATPTTFLLKRMEEKGLRNPRIHPLLTA
ncbi:hypothetical protein FRC11_008546, partial [Ceratobasidium sp. 423]